MVSVTGGALAAKVLSPRTKRRAKNALARVVRGSDPWRVGNLLNYLFNPFATRAVGDLAYDPQRVIGDLRSRGVDVGTLEIDVGSFRAWCERNPFPREYRDGYGTIFVEKALEHYVGAELLRLGSDDVFVDVAAAGSPWRDMAASAYGCDAYALDVAYSPGFHGKRIGADATAMPLPDGFAVKMALHCSYEMFEGHADTAFVAEAARVLRPGGRTVIVPLYLSDTYHIFRGPFASTRGLPNGDPEARVVYRRDFGSLRFARFYDVDRLLERVLRPAEAVGLRARVLKVENAGAIDPICYLAWILVLEKPDPQHISRAVAPLEIASEM